MVDLYNNIQTADLCLYLLGGETRVERDSTGTNRILKGGGVKFWYLPVDRLQLTSSPPYRMTIYNRINPFTPKGSPFDE